jgi:SAM-dependent methyltransferase
MTYGLSNANGRMRNQTQSDGDCWRGQIVQGAKLHFYNKLIVDLLRPHVGRHVLEIGVGIGNIAECLMCDSGTYIGLDNNEEHISYARGHFYNRPFEGHVVDIERETELSFLKEQMFDSIISVNCLEHIRDDTAVLTSIGKYTKPETRFCFLVPAHQALFGALDVHAGHFRRYNKQDLRGKCEGAGFVVEGMRFVNVVGALGWLAIGKLLKSSGNKIASTPGELNWRWNLLYGAARVAKYPLMLILSLEKHLPCIPGLSLIAWGKKK